MAPAPVDNPFRSATRRKRWFVVPVVVSALLALLWLSRGRNEQRRTPANPTSPAAGAEAPLVPPRPALPPVTKSSGAAPA